MWKVPFPQRSRNVAFSELLLKIRAGVSDLIPFVFFDRIKPASGLHVKLSVFFI